MSNVEKACWAILLLLAWFMLYASIVRLADEGVTKRDYSPVTPDNAGRGTDHGASPLTNPTRRRMRPCNEKGHP